MTEDTAASERERLRILAHELRSPVSALAAVLEAAPQLRDPKERRRLVDLAIAAARDVERLLSDPELVSLRREPVDLRALVTGVTAPEVRIHVDGDPVADADPTRLRQVLANLVANGLRHGTCVEIDVREEDARAVLEVSDDGPGLDAGLDPFARGSGTAGSTGYGLWLARAVAEAHGGSLVLVSDDGAGARFRLVLPLASGGR